MRTVALFAALIALSSSAVADPTTAHRRVVAGAVLTAIGAATFVAGTASLAYGVANPPLNHAQPLQPAFCTVHGCGLPTPTNWPLDGGAIALGLGAAALGAGVALVVVGKRGERPVTVAANGLSVRF
jgi:hypothetical protein